MEYYTQENNKSEPTPAGSEFLRQYAPAKTKEGKTYLKQVGKKNVYEMIQADKDNAVLYTMIEKYNKTGDATIFNTRETFYDNFLNVASTPAERENQLLMAEYAFESLDKEIRQEFNNDVGQFRMSILNGDFDKKMSKFINKQKNEIKEENTPKNTETTQQGVNL